MRLVTVEEVLEGELPAVEWLVQPLIARGERCILYGEWGSLKSFIMLHLALHLAAGRDWLGFHIDKPYRVLYIDEEMRLRGAWRRMWRFAKGEGIILPPQHFALTSDARFKARNNESARGLLEQVQRDPKGFDPDVIIVETLRATLRGSSTSDENIEDYFDYLYPFWSGGRTLIITHHMRKPPVDGGRESNKHEARGSGRILEFPDVGFAVTRPGHPEVVQVEHIKTRETQRFKPFGVALEDHCTVEQPCQQGDHRCTATLRRADEEAVRLIGGDY